MVWVYTASEWMDAPPERVWAVLVDFGAYPEWNPFTPAVRCTRMFGGLVVAERVQSLDVEAEGTLYTTQDRIEGPLAWLVAGLMGCGLEQGFAQVATALRDRVAPPLG